MFGGPDTGYLMLDKTDAAIQHPPSRIKHLQISWSERKCDGNFEGSILTRSDFTCSTIRSRTFLGNRSTMAE